VRLVHGSQDAPAIDLAITGGVPIVANVRPGEASVAVDIPSGTYALELRAAGATNVLLPLPGTVLAPNTSYTIFVLGSLQGGTLGAVLVPVLIPRKRLLPPHRLLEQCRPCRRHAAPHFAQNMRRGRPRCPGRPR
jgi:hypothetical protein